MAVELVPVDRRRAAPAGPRRRGRARARDAPRPSRHGLAAGHAGAPSRAHRGRPAVRARRLRHEGRPRVVLFALRALAARGALPAVTVLLTPLEEVDCEPYRALMEAEMAASARRPRLRAGLAGRRGQDAAQGLGVVRRSVRAARVARRRRPRHAAPTRSSSSPRQCLRRQRRSPTSTAASRPTWGSSAAGSRPNVVPDLAEAEIDVRFRTLGRRRVAAGVAPGPAASRPAPRLEVEGGPSLPAARARAAGS